MMTELDSLVAPTLTFLIFAPLLAGVVALLWPRGLVLDLLSISLGAISLVLLVPLSGTVMGQGPLLLELGGHELPLGIPLYVDGLALAMLWLTALTGLGTAVYASGWLRSVSHPSGQQYRVLWFLLWSGLNALFVSGDLFNIYVTLEITTLAAVPLVALARGREALSAAMQYLYFALVGSILFLLGVALVYAETGLLALPELSARESEAAGPGETIALLAITVGLAMKAALFPAHGWLPRAHAAASTPASALLSALVAKAAAYLVIRLWLGPFEAAWTPAVAQLMGVVGVLGILYGSLQALRQHRLKPVIAYSTVAQLGYLLLLIPLASVVAWQGVIYHALVHGLAKAAFFLAAGNLILGIGHDRLVGLAGCDRVLSKNLLAMAVAGVAIAGLPPTGGFIAKWWMITAALEQGQWWWAVAIGMGGLLAALYVFRVVSFAVHSPRPWHEEPLRETRHGLNRLLLWPPVLLAAAAVALGMTGELLAPFLAVGAPEVSP